MNPSAPDWIKKFLNLFERKQIIDNFNNENDFFTQLKDTGFIYGVSVKAIVDDSISSLALTKEEYTKVNLLHSLIYTYYSVESGTYKDAIESITSFYKKMEKGKTKIFHKLSLSKSKSNLLEGILSARIQESDLSLKKNTASILTHALLYSDVLSFKYFLKHPNKIKSYSKQLESEVISFCFLALKSKLKKSKYDHLIIELFESSAEYLTESNDNLDLEGFHMSAQREFLERKYMLDLCCIAVWDDHEMDEGEYQFLKELSQTLQLNDLELDESLKSLAVFSKKNTASIQLFEYAHPVKQFYKQSAATVKLLILRNRKRLVKELNESGELLVLLGQSTLRDLDDDEKGKVKEQLLDICKSVPSLTLFLLPGGTILLPLLVKFIPKLLPSAFDDNRIEVKKKD